MTAGLTSDLERSEVGPAFLPEKEVVLEGPKFTHVLLVDGGEQSAQARKICQALGSSLRVVEEAPSSPECPCPYLIAPKGAISTVEGIRKYVESYTNAPRVF